MRAEDSWCFDGRAAEFEQDIPFGAIVDALNDPVASDRGVKSDFDV